VRFAGGSRERQTKKEWLMKAPDIKTHLVRGCTSQRFGETAIEGNVALTKFSRDAECLVNSMCFRKFRRSHKTTTALAALSATDSYPASFCVFLTHSYEAYSI
jgi:hypothetical protein